VYGGGYDAFVTLYSATPNDDIQPNGSPTIMFQNSTSGALVYWLMNGANMTQYGFTNPPIPGPVDWKLVASPDITGDGQPDLLFQNQATSQLVYWKMNGFDMVLYSSLRPSFSGSPDWKVVGTADFDGNGSSDLLFQNSSTGQLVYWLMNRFSLIQPGFISPSDPGSPLWRVVGLADFNGDGQPDILFQNSSTGDLVVWLMNGTDLAEIGVLHPSTPGAGWQAASIIDLNNDGKPDILFQNQSTGQIVYWLLNGGDLVQWGYLNPADPGGPTWRLALPH
jgi:aromatic ring-cleaving dioxygenase